MKLLRASGLVYLLLLLGFAARLGAQDEPALPRKPVAVFLLRHGETLETAGKSQDPELSPEGEGRARDLARLLGQAGATRLFATEYARTQATLAPLAAALGLSVEAVPARETERLAETLRALPPGTVAVVAGHSNTVPALVAALGGELKDLAEGGVLAHDAYDRLALVTLPADGPPQTIELRYGR
jgi:broad specificity phosphatase PhoE